MHFCPVGHPESRQHSEPDRFQSNTAAMRRESNRALNARILILRPLESMGGSVL
jgi:hypothetical protein